VHLRAMGPCLGGLDRYVAEVVEQWVRSGRRVAIEISAERRRLWASTEHSTVVLEVAEA
jgi:hypothetical protein